MRRMAIRVCMLGLFLHPIYEAHAYITGDLPSPDEATERAQILSLRDARLPYLALSAARRHPGSVSDAEMRQLEADYAAELTRLAGITTRTESERFRVADRALAMYDRMIPEWRALGAPAASQLTRIRIDRLQALHARVRMQDVVDEYESLIYAGTPVPDYALPHVAAAYLYLRQPERAADLYRRSLENPGTDDPATRMDKQIGLFYSLIEAEQFEDAQRVIQATTDEQPIWKRIKGIPRELPNDLRLEAEHTAAVGLLYTDDTSTAQEKLTHMVEQAPHHANLRTSLAAVYRARQWPRRAREELKIAESMEARAVTVEARQAEIAMDLQQWEHAKLLLDDLQARVPENVMTRSVAREWNSHNKAELNVSAAGGLTSDNPAAGKNDLSLETVLYSVPLQYNWRPFAGVGYKRGEFEEGRTNFKWARAGVQWRGGDLTAELEGSSQHYGHGAKVGVKFSAAYDLNDHWQISGLAALRSLEAPVRALHHDISSNSVAFSVRWRGNERREWSLAISPSRFTDGNKRIEANLAGRERIYTSPRFKADAELSVYASHNSRRDAPYFNPRSDVEVLPSVNLSHTLYRRYETMLQHNLRLGAGVYRQRGYSPGAVGLVGYGMRYHHDENLEIGASVIGLTRPYDGQRERELRFMLDMILRF